MSNGEEEGVVVVEEVVIPEDDVVKVGSHWIYKSNKKLPYTHMGNLYLHSLCKLHLIHLTLVLYLGLE